MPWADVVYGCDAAWWQYRNGLPGFDGLKICYEKNNLAGFPDIRRIAIHVKNDNLLDRLLFDKTGKTGSGGNSGFQALNLAVQWGARKVLLIGYDMSNASGYHWYGRNSWRGANNPTDGIYGRWIQAFNTAAAQLRQMGVTVINCSQYSALECFPKMSIVDALGG